MKALGAVGVTVGMAILGCFALPSPASANVSTLTPYLTPQAKQLCDGLGYMTRMSYPFVKCFVENVDPGYGEEFSGNYCVQRVVLPPGVNPAIRGVGYYYVKATDLGIFEGCNIGWYQTGDH